MNRVEDFPLLPWASRWKTLHFPLRCILYRIIDESGLEYRSWLFIFKKQISLNNSCTYWLLYKGHRSSDLRHIPSERTSHPLRGRSLISCVIESNRLLDKTRHRRRSWEREKPLAIPYKWERSHRLSDSLEGWWLLNWPQTENVAHHWELCYTKRWNSQGFLTYWRNCGSNVTVAVTLL
jgi:hypothetical protein